jgi:hypothetical protein
MSKTYATGMRETAMAIPEIPVKKRTCGGKWPYGEWGNCGFLPAVEKYSSCQAGEGVAQFFL